MIRIQKDTGTPFIAVKVPGLDADAIQAFFDAGLPFFESAERAMKTYAMVRGYQLWKEKRG